MLLNGLEVKRQIGFNFNLVKEQCDSVIEYHTNENDYYGDTGNQWERFYDSFDRWQKDGEYDRDAMRMLVDSQADTHRGPGSIKNWKKCLDDSASLHIIYFQNLFKIFN